MIELTSYMGIFLWKYARFCFGIAAIVSILSGCSGGGGGGVAPVTLSSITVAPYSATIAMGLTAHLQAMGVYSDGSTADITTSSTWLSVDQTIASVGNNTGVVTPVAIGYTSVTAQLGNILSTPIPVSITSANLTAINVSATPATGINVTPANISARIGLPVTFTATGTFSDGTTGNISGSINWLSSNTSIATINSSGVATGTAIGSTSITAAQAGITSPSSTFVVNDAVLSTINVKPTSQSTPKGRAVTFSAVGSYTDGTVGNLLNPATWNSSDQLVATIDSGGVATTLGVGNTNISVTAAGITVNATLTVTAPILDYITIGPSVVNTTAGMTQQFTASGVMTDGAAATLGAKAWYSSDTSIATINSTGSASALYPGVTNISMSSGGVTSNFVVLTVTPIATPSNVVVSSMAATCYDFLTGIGDALPVGQVTVSWPVVPGATSYNIYYGITPGLTSSSSKISGVSSPYVYNVPPGSGKYYFRVSAVGAGESLLSTEVSTFIYNGVMRHVGTTPASPVTPLAGRHSGTATLLSNGNVLFTGGKTEDPGYFMSNFNTTYIYSSATNSFTPSGNMSVGRSYHTATLLPDGKVLIVGGEGQAGLLYSAEIYNPATGVFTPTGSMMVQRFRFTATLLSNGKVLIAGGNFPGDTSPALLYDPIAGVFSNTGDMITRRVGHTATLLSNGKVLILGGTSSVGGALSSAELYDPATGVFSSTGNNMADARYRHSSVLLQDGTVLVVGGYNQATGLSLSTADIYNPSTGLFNPTKNKLYAGGAGAWNSHTSTLLSNGQVLISGGCTDAELCSGGVGGKSRLYDPSSGFFLVSNALYGNGALLEHTSTLLPNGKVLMVGSWSYDEIYSTLFE